jgi:hypothetical protein
MREFQSGQYSSGRYVKQSHGHTEDQVEKAITAIVPAKALRSKSQGLPEGSKLLAG